MAVKLPEWATEASTVVRSLYSSNEALADSIANIVGKGYAAGLLKQAEEMATDLSHKLGKKDRALQSKHLRSMDKAVLSLRKAMRELKAGGKAASKAIMNAKNDWHSYVDEAFVALEEKEGGKLDNELADMEVALVKLAQSYND